MFGAGDFCCCGGANFLIHFYLFIGEIKIEKKWFFEIFFGGGGPLPHFFSYFLFFFSSSISSTQIVIPWWTAGGGRALWVSEHPLWRTRYCFIFFQKKIHTKFYYGVLSWKTDLALSKVICYPWVQYKV